jgi:hypothetical protein
LHHLGHESDFAELLWQMASDEGHHHRRDDATRRIGVRSLLRRMPSDDSDVWLVDFFHRSVREYYVARGIISAAAHGGPEDLRMLNNVTLPPEIKWFASEMMKREESTSILAQLEALAKRKPRGSTGRRLGGNCITLLAGALGRLPHRNWTGLTLDYCDLTGADLEGVNFSNSSLRHALLDDANLEAVNFTNSDLTGLRLEETADVEAVVGQEGGMVVAAYADGLLRRWQMKPQRTVPTIIAVGVPRLVDSMKILPNDDVVIASRQHLLIYVADTHGNESRELQTDFGLLPFLRIQSFGEAEATACVEIGRGTDLLVAPTNKVGVPASRPMVDQVTCSAAKYPAVLAYGTDEGAKVEWWRNNEERSECALQRPGVTAITLLEPEKPTELLVVTGHRDGVVEMSRINLEDARMENVWRTRPHRDVVSCLDSTSQYVISGSADRSISVINRDDGKVYRSLQRTVRCKGMVITGVAGTREYEMLADLLARAASAS